MTKAKTSFKTIKQGASDVLYKSKGSKFIGFSKNISSPEDALAFFDQLKNNHNGANHCCYAYKVGMDPSETRVNDDGEPSHSAGTPILGQIQSFGLTNTAIAVIRYFGGTKLGVGGLIKAYKTTAQLTLEQSEFMTQHLHSQAELRFEYEQVGAVMQWIKTNQYNVEQKHIDRKSRVIFQLPITDQEKARLYWTAFQQVELSIH